MLPVAKRAFIFLCFFAFTAACQETTGNIRGTVTDPSGAGVPAAKITVTNTDKNAVIRTATTGSQGDYSAVLLPVGHYSVKAEATGFALATISGIELNVDDRLTIDIALKVGDVTQAVTVESEPLQVDLESPTSAGLISGTQVRELPINNRNYEQLVALSPGVSSGVADQIFVGVSNPAGTSNQINFSINGNRPTQNNWTIDGADNVDRGANLTLLSYPSIDSIEEFKILRGLYNPEFGRSSGGEINVITRSGGSSYHGSLYEFFRNDRLDANRFFNNQFGIKRPPLRYNDFGGTFGGPIYIPGRYNLDKNKTFFFVSEEARRIITYTTFQSGEAPTPAELAGNFPAAVCLDAACSATGTHVSNISPVAQQYIKDIYSKLPAPNGPNNSYVFTGRNVFNYRQDTVRLDHYFSQKFTVMFRFMNDDIPTEEPGGLFTGSALPNVARTSTNSPGRNYAFRATWTLKPNLINEAGFAYSYGAVISHPIGLGAAANSPDIHPTLPFAPQLARVPDLSFGDGESITGFGPYLDYNRNRNFFDNLSWSRGAHTMKFGFAYHRYQKDENNGGGSNGSFSFTDSSPNGNGPSDGTFQQEFANFLQGNVFQFSQTNIDARAVINQNQIEAYGQDEWRIRKNFTLTYGVRYSLFFQPTDAHNRLSSFDPALYNAAAAAKIDPTTGLLVPGAAVPVVNGLAIAGQTSRFGNAIAHTPKALLAPRLGFAWDPFGDGKTSVRSGYGIFYDSPSVGVVENNTLNNPPFVANRTFSNTVLDNPGRVSPDVSLAPLSVFSTQPDWKQPYTQEWSFDIQRQLPRNFLLDVGYYGSKGTHLIGVVDINEPQPLAYLAANLTNGKIITPATTVLLNAVRPYLGYDAINMFSPRFDSSYHSLQTQVQKRFGGNGLAVFNYTWSHNLTNAQNDFRTPQNTYDFKSERGNAQFDRRHIVTSNFVYDLPFFKTQQGFAGRALGGWELSGIVTIESGLPLTVTNGRRVDPAGLGLLDANSFAGRRPDLVADPNGHAPHQIARWFNTAAFKDIPAGVFRPGNAGRGVVRGPGLQRWDLSLFKNIKFYENLRAQFRLETFNTFNHTNFDTVSTSLSSSLFGRVTGTRDPRILQLGLKLLF